MKAVKVLKTKLRPIKKEILKIKYARRQKIFCIGLNKTGTTSIKKALEEMDIVVGKEYEAKTLFHSWAIRDFKPIIKYCKTAQAFQDSPFSFPYTYVVLDQAYPDSKFILSVRDNAEQWYSSLTRFHSKLWSSEKGEIPTKNDLMNAFNFTKGRPWLVNRALYNSPEDLPYKKNVLIDFYETHNKNVIDYFRHRQKDLLILNVSNKEAYQKLASFLNINTSQTEFPWENKTDEKY